MKESYQILVVDESNTTGEILKAILEPRGVDVQSCQRQPEKEPSKKNRLPDLLVIHQKDKSAVSEEYQKIPQIVVRESIAGLFDYRDLLSDVVRFLDRHHAPVCKSV